MALEMEGDTEEDEAIAHIAEVGFKQRPTIGKGKGKGKQKQLTRAAAANARINKVTVRT